MNAENWDMIKEHIDLDKPMFTINSCCCQLGYFCPCCAGIDIPVHAGDGSGGGGEVGNLDKKQSDCLEWCCDTQTFVGAFKNID